MNEAGKNIIQHLFGNQNLADISRRELETLAEKYPYFSVPQLLLAKKLYDNNSNGKDEQLRKTALHFSNPYWLNYLLHEDEITSKADNISIENLEEDITPQSITTEDIKPLTEEIVSEEKDEIVPAVEVSIQEINAEPTDEIIPAIEVPEEGVVNETDEIVPALEITAKELAVEPKDEIIPAVEVPEEGVVNETDEIVPALEVTAKELAVEPKDEIIPAVEVPEEGVINETDEIVPALEVTAKELAVEPKDEIIPAVEIPEEGIVNETDEIIPAIEVENAALDNLEEYTVEEEEIDTTTNDASDSQRLKLSSIIEQHLADFKKPVDDNVTLPIKSSPFHTIDYFASQGIKMDGQDNLSNRVRKFTDWLKQMKGKNPQPNDLGTDLETEKLIETIAASSNEEKDIVTEAMAEVLIKQGKTEKAIHLYKKLGLLNPDKSAYFAAKIDVLNNN